jgi:hypothetical protein
MDKAMNYAAQNPEQAQKAAATAGNAAEAVDTAQKKAGGMKVLGGAAAVGGAAALAVGGGVFLAVAGAGAAAYATTRSDGAGDVARSTGNAAATGYTKGAVTWASVLPTCDSHA